MGPKVIWDLEPRVSLSTAEHDPQTKAIIEIWGDSTDIKSYAWQAFKFSLSPGTAESLQPGIKTSPENPNTIRAEQTFTLDPDIGPLALLTYNH